MAKNASVGCVAIGDLGIEEIFCLAARAGVAKIKVLIVPTDWRMGPFEVPRDAPAWVTELYSALKTELAQLPQ
jgi:hypothetical protein